MGLYWLRQGWALLVRRSRPGLRLQGSWNIMFALTCPSPSHFPLAISVTWGQAAFVGPIRADHLYWCWAPKISVCLSTQLLLLLKWLFMQVTLEQHRFEVCGPSHLLKFFSLDTCFVFHPGLGVWGCTESTVCSDLWPFHIGDRTPPVLV